MYLNLIITENCLIGFQSLIYEKGGVFIHTTVARPDEDALVEGKVVLHRKVRLLVWILDGLFTLN